ncbi:unnamed protein product [Ambrosiozyma monospora]|uniref:Phosphatidylinositol transfer protein SFH5 n=1 Tax=Ambrosiozyma monospora TaxID=43982 RepID=A0A9W7DIZ1_AMBMO|nr:unnamed protein product [Ambrosiozyma monospora]
MATDPTEIKPKVADSAEKKASEVTDTTVKPAVATDSKDSKDSKDSEGATAAVKKEVKDETGATADKPEANEDDKTPEVEKTNKYKLEPEQFDKLVAFKENAVPEVLDETEYDELFGYQVDPKGKFYDEEIADRLLIKILKSTAWDAVTAKETLTKVLKWRKEFKPLSAAFKEEHDAKYDSSVLITVNPEGDANLRVVTWNFYGKVSDPSVYFADPESFLRWRVGLMERAMQLLDFTSDDNDYMVQIHDYDNVSLFRMDPKAKTASTSVIAVFKDYYPELLSKKWFVNVPFLMAWLYTMFKSFVPEVTRKKFAMLRAGTELSEYISGGSKAFPISYGGLYDGPVEDLKYEVKKDQMTKYTKFILQKEEEDKKLADELD